MAGFLVIGVGLSLLVLFATLLIPMLPTQQIALFNITIDTSLLTLYFFVFCTLYNLTMLAVIAIYDNSRLRAEKTSETHRFSIMIPASNEEQVISNTLDAVFRMDYPSDKFDVLVIDDGSVDKTPQILEHYKSNFSNLSILRVATEESRKGKSTALNRGFKYLLDKNSNADRKNWIIGVFDADGVPDPEMLKKISYQFLNKEVGAVQTLVRIGNRKNSLLARLQDVEFVTFAKVTQYVRNIFHGAVGLGGNGQFIRASALESIQITPGEYWRRDSLTEDLDLGTRVLLAGWENAFVSTTYVNQQGVIDWKALYRQRTRWCWGTLQTFSKYLVSLDVFKHKISIVKKIDLAYYLSFQMILPAVLLIWILSFLGLLGVILISNSFPVYFMIANSISFFPLIGYGLWTTRKEYPIRLLIPLLFITTAYTYHWIICTICAFIHILKRDSPKWVKTTKISDNPI